MIRTSSTGKPQIVSHNSGFIAGWNRVRRQLVNNKSD